jgi:hypothetical protein
MVVRLTLLTCLVALAACAATPPVDSAQMPPAFGLGDPVNAIEYSAWAFAAPSRTRGDPASAARAVAAIDYLAGQLNTNPEWRQMDQMVSTQMLSAREAVRRVLGIAAGASSQAVVNSMVALSIALGGGNRTAALRTLQAPIFILGPERTLALLSDLPFIPAANVATSEASAALNRSQLRGSG